MDESIRITVSRKVGLDIFRSAAILIVLYSHLKYLDLNGNYFKTSLLVDGVDLFFVLSGFLVGDILLREFNDSNNRFEFLKSFLFRRWTRTLPLYYFFLFANILLISLELIPGTWNEHNLVFFVFLQNFYVPVDFMFWQSWSLSVEEWFYISFPTILLFSASFFTKNRSILFTIFIFLFVPLVIRLLMYNPDLDWDLFFRKLVVTRLDAIGFGVWIAYLNIVRPFLLQKFKILLLSLGIIILISNLFLVGGMIHYYTFSLSLNTLGLSLLIPFFLHIKQFKFSSIFTFISRISYSLYLSHLPILFILNGSFFRTKMNDLIVIGLYLSLVFLLSYVLYRTIELPFINLRKKLENHH